MPLRDPNRSRGWPKTRQSNPCASDEEPRSWLAAVDARSTSAARVRSPPLNTARSEGVDRRSSGVTVTCCPRGCRRSNEVSPPVRAPRRHPGNPLPALHAATDITFRVVAPIVLIPKPEAKHSQPASSVMRSISTPAVRFQPRPLESHPHGMERTRRDSGRQRRCSHASVRSIST
jgi:hypothetical protein